MNCLAQGARSLGAEQDARTKNKALSLITPTPCPHTITQGLRSKRAPPPHLSTTWPCRTTTRVCFDNRMGHSSNNAPRQPAVALHHTPSAVVVSSTQSLTDGGGDTAAFSAVYCGMTAGRTSSEMGKLARVRFRKHFENSMRPGYFELAEEILMESKCSVVFACWEENIGNESRKEKKERKICYHDIL